MAIDTSTRAPAHAETLLPHGTTLAEAVEPLLEGLVPFNEAAKWIPSGRAGKPAHVSKLHRSRYPGTSVPDGRRIRLQAVRTSAGWCTTRRWVSEYLAAVTAAYEGQAVEPPTLHTTAARRQAIARAESELSADGF